jgi:hypothetical protein
MSAAKHLLAATAAAGIFAAGFLAGCGSGGRGGEQAKGPPIAPLEQRWSQDTLGEYQRRLQLTPSQVEKIRPMFGETAARMGELRQSLKAELHATLRRMNERVSAELTVEQRREFVTLIREKQAGR